MMEDNFQETFVALMVDHAVSIEGVDGVRMWAYGGEWRVIGENMIPLHRGDDFLKAF